VCFLFFFNSASPFFFFLFLFFWRGRSGWYDLPALPNQPASLPYQLQSLIVDEGRAFPFFSRIFPLPSLPDSIFSPLGVDPRPPSSPSRLFFPRSRVKSRCRRVSEDAFPSVFLSVGKELAFFSFHEFQTSSTGGSLFFFPFLRRVGKGGRKGEQGDGTPSSETAVAFFFFPLFLSLFCGQRKGRNYQYRSSSLFSLCGFRPNLDLSFFFFPSFRFPETKKQ